MATTRVSATGTPMMTGHRFITGMGCTSGGGGVDDGSGSGPEEWVRLGMVWLSVLTDVLPLLLSTARAWTHWLGSTRGVNGSSSHAVTPSIVPTYRTAHSPSNTYTSTDDPLQLSTNNSGSLAVKPVQQGRQAALVIFKRGAETSSNEIFLQDSAVSDNKPLMFSMSILYKTLWWSNVTRAKSTVPLKISTCSTCVLLGDCIKAHVFADTVNWMKLLLKIATVPLPLVVSTKSVMTKSARGAVM